MSVIRWLVMQEVCRRFEFARHFESHLAQPVWPSPFYMRMRTTTSDGFHCYYVARTIAIPITQYILYTVLCDTGTCMHMLSYCVIIEDCYYSHACARCKRMRNHVDLALLTPPPPPDTSSAGSPSHCGVAMLSVAASPSNSLPLPGRCCAAIIRFICFYNYYKM